MKNGQVKSTMHVKLLQKNYFVANVWPANLAVLFMFQPITLKLLNII